MKSKNVAAKLRIKFGSTKLLQQIFYDISFLYLFGRVVTGAWLLCGKSIIA